MPYAIVNRDGSEAIAVGATEAEARENVGLDARERHKHRVVNITEIFRGFGEDRDQEATGTLEAKLNLCPNSDRRNQTRLVVDTRSKPPSNSLRILSDSRALIWTKPEF